MYKPLVVYSLIALAGIAAIVSSKVRADDLPPQLAKTYSALQQHQPVYRIRLDGTPTPAEANLAALAEDGEYYHLLNPAERQACIDRRRAIAGLIGLLAIADFVNLAWLGFVRMREGAGQSALRGKAVRA